MTHHDWLLMLCGSLSGVPVGYALCWVFIVKPMTRIIDSYDDPDECLPR